MKRSGVNLSDLFSVSINPQRLKLTFPWSSIPHLGKETVIVVSGCHCEGHEEVEEMATVHDVKYSKLTMTGFYYTFIVVKQH
jgi:hypothetical protein